MCNVSAMKRKKQTCALRIRKLKSKTKVKTMKALYKYIEDSPSLIWPYEQKWNMVG